MRADTTAALANGSHQALLGFLAAATITNTHVAKIRTTIQDVVGECNDASADDKVVQDLISTSDHPRTLFDTAFSHFNTVSDFFETSPRL